MNDETKAIEDVIPITMANLRGHRMLYDEGWFIVTSSDKALEYAGKHAIVSSGRAVRRALRKERECFSDYKHNLRTHVQDSVQLGKNCVKTGTEISRSILAGTHDLAKEELTHSGTTFKKAWKTFIQGTIYIAQRTEKDRRELMRLPGNYFRDLKEDLSNLDEISGALQKKVSNSIELSWEKAFQQAGQEFRSEYEKSGQENNSLIALGHILYGYLKSFYHGLVKPCAKSIVRAGAEGSNFGIFLPTAKAIVVTGRTVQSIGLSLYYGGKTGIKVISPTVEGGFLTSLSVLSLGSAPVTYVAGSSLGFLNQVAFSTAGAGLATGGAAVNIAVDTSDYVGFVAYDTMKATTKVIINQTASGVVLGYNALTAIPTHLLLGAMDAAVFLAWDGPRLVIVAAGEDIRLNKPEDENVNIQNLPVGTVIDLKKLEEQEGVEVKVLSEDPKVIRDVIQKIPDDLRHPHSSP